MTTWDQSLTQVRSSHSRIVTLSYCKVDHSQPLSPPLNSRKELSSSTEAGRIWKRGSEPFLHRTQNGTPSESGRSSWTICYSFEKNATPRLLDVLLPVAGALKNPTVEEYLAGSTILSGLIFQKNRHRTLSPGMAEPHRLQCHP